MAALGVAGWAALQVINQKDRQVGVFFKLGMARGNEAAEGHWPLL